MKYTFQLLQKAKKTGGDKYSCNSISSEWIIYIPQEISRQGDPEPKNVIEMSM